jgi:hypothetical protein
VIEWSGEGGGKDFLARRDGVLDCRAFDVWRLMKGFHQDDAALAVEACARKPDAPKGVGARKPAGKLFRPTCVLLEVSALPMRATVSRADPPRSCRGRKIESCVSI